MTFPFFRSRPSRHLVFGALIAAFMVLPGCVTTQQYEALQSQLDEA